MDDAIIVAEPKKDEVGGRRELQKMSFGGTDVSLETLDSIGGEKFDQFSKTKTTYSDNLYTTKIDE